MTSIWRLREWLEQQRHVAHRLDRYRAGTRLDLATCTPESINPTHEQITRTSLEAHQTLMSMSAENVARFKDVTQFLAEDLRSLEKAS